MNDSRIENLKLDEDVALSDVDIAAVEEEYQALLSDLDIKLTDKSLDELFMSNPTQLEQIAVCVLDAIKAIKRGDAFDAYDSLSLAEYCAELLGIDRLVNKINNIGILVFGAV